MRYDGGELALLAMRFHCAISYSNSSYMVFYPTGIPVESTNPAGYPQDQSSVPTYSLMGLGIIHYNLHMPKACGVVIFRRYLNSVVIG